MASCHRTVVLVISVLLQLSFRIHASKPIFLHNSYYMEHRIFYVSTAHGENPLSKQAIDENAFFLWFLSLQWNQIFSMFGKRTLICLKAWIPTFTWSILQQIYVTVLEWGNIFRTSSGTETSSNTLGSFMDYYVLKERYWMTMDPVEYGANYRCTAFHKIDLYDWQIYSSFVFTPLMYCSLFECQNERWASQCRKQ